MRRTLVVDLGSSAVKCGLVEPDGRLLRRASVPLTARLDGPAAELDLGDLCSAVGRAVADVAPDGVDVVVPTGQMGSHVWVDAAGSATGPAVLWTDRRDMTAGTALLDRLDPDRFHRVTGQRWPGLAARMHWGRATGRDGVAVPLRQWLLRRLTGVWAVDPSDASVTGCLDVAAGGWSESTCRRLDVPTADLLPVRAPTDVAGALDGDGAALLGLRPGTPVLVGAGDGPCASLGADAAGAVGCLTLASSGTMRLLVDHVVPDPARTATCLAFAGRYVVSLPVSNVGFALEWACRALGFGTVAELERAAAAAAPDPTLTFQPYLAGERFPYWDRDRTAGFAGVRADHDRGDLASAVLAGVAYTLRRCVDHVGTLGLPLTEVRVNGGAAGCASLVGRLAALLDVPVVTTTGDTLHGAAALAGADVRADLVEVPPSDTDVAGGYQAWLSRQ